MQFLFTLLFVIIISMPSIGQTVKKDFIFNYKISKDNMWIPIDSSFQRYNPTLSEVQLAKELSIKHIDSLQNIRNQETDKDTSNILNYEHEEYLRQYLGYIDNEGNRIIFINACCVEFAEDINLERHWVFAMDGGSCYFQIKINLKKKECFDFNVNGDS